MLTDAVLQYIRESLRIKKTEEEIIDTLVKAKWPYDDVVEAIEKIRQEKTVSAASEAAPTSRLAQARAEPTESSSSIRDPIQVISQRPIKSHRTIAVGIIVILVLALGGVAAAQFTGIIQLPFLDALNIGPDPEKIFDEGLANVPNVRSGSYKLEVSLKSEAKNPATTPIISEDMIKKSGSPPGLAFGTLEGSLAFTVAGTYDTSTSTSADAQSRISIEVTFGTTSGSADVEILKKGSIYYVQLHSIHIPEELSRSRIPDLSPITEKWIKITPEDIKQFGAMGAGLTRMIPFQVPNDEANRVATEKATSEFQRILRLAREEKVLGFKEKPAKETLGEATTFRYNLKIQGENIPALYKRITTESTSTLGFTFGMARFDQKTFDYLKSQDFQGIVSRINQNMTWEEWIDIATKFITKGSFAINILPVQESAMQYSVTAINTLSNINEPAPVHEPTDAIPARDVLSLLGQAIQKNAPKQLPHFDTAQ